MLEERYEGVLPSREVDFKLQLRGLLTTEEVWWTQYIGKVGFLISSLYPTGFIDQHKPRIGLSSIRTTNLDGDGIREGLQLTISIVKVKNDLMKLREVLEDSLKIIEKIGRRKNWIGGKDGWGLAVTLVIEEDLLS